MFSTLNLLEVDGFGQDFFFNDWIWAYIPTSGGKIT